MASMLIPALEEAKLTEEHSRSVEARASGIELISAISPCVHPFSTRAEYPPIKSMFKFLAQKSKVRAILT